MIQRYDLCVDECDNAWIGEDADGEYVMIKDLKPYINGYVWMHLFGEQ